ncbi:Ger(x)C family spore germination protein [uncultured Paenibacillus sp.]|uniref:Ger(x)C family spore germination protein n=1 Tax=uncultured Paenibacillus sp. TaxID=227322 RepID=UPI0015A7AB05|nr:Ger(x)C family spore germination protein [uncultured Paenibacillus sp.]
MRERIVIAALLIAGLAILPGCWSKKELNELAVVMALGIDRDREGYAVSAQVMNSSEVGSQQRSSIGSSPVVTYTAVGKTIPDALQRMLEVTPRLLYLSHVRVLVFGEDMARQGVSDAMDFISRNRQLRTDFYLLVAKGMKASDILQVVTPFEHIPANSLYSSILVSNKKSAAMGRITLRQFITELDSSGSNPVLSGVEVRGPRQTGNDLDNVRRIKPDTILKHAGLAVFVKDRLVGWLGESGSKSINYVLNEVEMTAGNVPCPKGGVVGVEITHADSAFDVKLAQDGRPEFLVRLRLEANVNAVQCDLDLSKPSAVEDIEKGLANKLATNVERNIGEVQRKYGADIFGLGEALHRKYPKVWNKYRGHWEDHFRTMKVRVHSEVAIRHIGSIVLPERREMELR